MNLWEAIKDIGIILLFAIAVFGGILLGIIQGLLENPIVLLGLLGLSTPAFILRKIFRGR